ncbi:thioredoxin family protein [Patescibacteria group bacterium]
MSLTPSTMLPLGTKAPNFNLPTTKGTNISLSDFSDKKALVVMFICNHCPYVIHVKEELIRISSDYKDQSVGFIGINSNDPNHDPTDGFEHMKKENYPFPYAFDETQEVAKEYKAACTPDIFVFDEKRELIYRGQIDDSRPGNAKELTGKDLREALGSILKGKKPLDDQKPSSGCNIKWKPGNEPEYS